MRIRLAKEDYETVSSIVEKYRNLENEFNEVQTQLENLNSQKDLLLKNLESIREEENSFFDHLSTVHGEGKLDLLTMEYVTK